MKITPELIAIGILGVSLVSLGWKVSTDIRQELKQEIHHVREDVAVLGNRIGGLEHRIGGLEQRVGGLEQRVGGLEHRMGGLEHRMGGLEQRMARLEGWMEGRFTEELVLKPKPAK